MFKQEIGFYLGRERSDGFSGLVDENNLFLTVEIETGITPDKGRELTSYIREKINSIVIENLQQFDVFIANIIKDKNLPSGISFSAGYLKGNIFYLKTVNQGKVYIRRNNKLALLIENDETASGYIAEDDVYIFTFNKFIQLLGKEAGLEKKIDDRPIPEIIDEITPELLAKDDQGTTALFMKLKKFEEELRSANDFFETPGKRSQKTLTFATVFILGIILFWSVGLGYIRRSRENNQKKINLTDELISQKLDKAEEVAFLNMSSALGLIKDSKDEVGKLKKEVSLSYTGQLEKLDAKILQVENKILKREEKKHTEFFDLTVDDKAVRGDKFYLDNGRLLVSDRNRGVLYEISMEKKSLDKNQTGEIKRSSFIALFEEKKYFYVEGEGIYQLVGEKTVKAIEKDKNWGKIIDMSVFNGNIYLLDQGKDQIYKFMATDNGFGSGTSYFVSGQSINLSQVNSFAIDGSVFLVGNSVMFRYTSGLRDGFKVNLPDDNVNMNKIFTSRDLEKIYGWDKGKGVIYVMSKNGNYQEQINSKILSTGSDFVVYNNSIYVLQGSKIYKIE